MSVCAVGYLRIESQDCAAWMKFATEILGLMPATTTDDSEAHYLRMDDHPFRFAIEPGSQDRLLATGMEYRDEAEWRAVCNELRAAGHEVTLGSEVQAARRCVTAVAIVEDPSGNTLELYYGRLLDYRPFNSPAGIRQFITGDEYTGDMGFGHVVLPAPEHVATVDFYTNLIGLQVCDRLSVAQPESTVTFLHADNPRQHSLALYDQPVPAGVVHIMVEVGSLDEVGLTLDRVKRAGLPVLASLGRHVNDNMCSFYVPAPGGIAIEYGYDGFLVDWDNYTPTVSSEGDLWGHEYAFPGVNE